MYMTSPDGLDEETLCVMILQALLIVDIGKYFHQTPTVHTFLDMLKAAGIISHYSVAT